MSDELLIRSTDGEIGTASETDLPCADVEGCRGTQYLVVWPDGDPTIVCGQGLRWIDENTAQIMEAGDGE